MSLMDFMNFDGTRGPGVYGMDAGHAPPRRPRGLLDDPEQMPQQPQMQQGGSWGLLDDIGQRLNNPMVLSGLAGLATATQGGDPTSALMGGLRMSQNQQRALRDHQFRKAQAKENRRRYDQSYGLRREQFDHNRQRQKLLDQRSDPQFQYQQRLKLLEQTGIPLESSAGQQFALTGRLPAGAKKSIFDQRAQALIGMGLKPGTPKFKQMMFTGKWTEPQGGQTGVGTKIAGGLNQLARIPQQAGGSFEHATGPLQGDDDHSLLNPFPPIARAWGSMRNWVSPWGGEMSTTEVRNRIKGDSLALASTLKKIVREKGEGTFTDADQRQLNNIVGTLAQANNVEEYRSALENARERIMSNFGINLPPIQFPGAHQKLQGRLPQSAPQTAVNPQTGQRLMLDQSTGQWVPAR